MKTMLIALAGAVTCIPMMCFTILFFPLMVPILFFIGWLAIIPTMLIKVFFNFFEFLTPVTVKERNEKLESGALYHTLSVTRFI